ncbi:MAG: hypothetical protein E3K36_14960, partial [Candidatus Brocadia sp.]|nr:hypothetical protein [Candidatus Brocadia sp.]
MKSENEGTKLDRRDFLRKLGAIMVGAGLSHFQFVNFGVKSAFAAADVCPPSDICDPGTNNPDVCDPPNSEDKCLTSVGDTDECKGGSDICDPGTNNPDVCDPPNSEDKCLTSVGDTDECKGGSDICDPGTNNPDVCDPPNSEDKC